MKRKAILIKKSTHQLLTEEVKRKKERDEMCSIGGIASEYIEKVFRSDSPLNTPVIDTDHLYEEE